MYIGKMVKTEWKSEKGCLAVFFHVLGVHNSFLCISNFVDIFIVVQKIISWKAGKSELICLHGGLRLCHIGRKAKNFRAVFELFMGKKKISFPFK